MSNPKIIILTSQEDGLIQSKIFQLLLFLFWQFSLLEWNRTGFYELLPLFNHRFFNNLFLGHFDLIVRLIIWRGIEYDFIRLGQNIL